MIAGARSLVALLPKWLLEVLHHSQPFIKPDARLSNQGPTTAHVSSTSPQPICSKGSNRPISHILCLPLFKSSKWPAQWHPCERFSMNLGAKNLPLFNFTLIASISLLSCLLNKLFCFFHSALSNSCQMESLFWEPFWLVFTPILFVFLGVLLTTWRSVAIKPLRANLVASCHLLHPHQGPRKEIRPFFSFWRGNDWTGRGSWNPQVSRISLIISP